MEADSYRQWASWYITGASFWEVNWGQAVTYFGYVVPVAPNLYDSSYITATNRLATAQVGYSYDLVEEADYLLYLKGWCEAHELFRQAADYAPLDPTVQPTADFAAWKCEGNPDEGPEDTPEP